VRKADIVRSRKVDRVVPLFSELIFIPDFQVRIGGVMVDGVQGWLKIGDYYPFLPEVAPAVKRAKTPLVSRFMKRDRKLLLDMVGIRRLESDGNIPVARRRRLYKIGQLVRVIDGPFAAFNGTIEHLDSKGRLTVLLDIFKRLTPLHLDEGQIEAA
jgi:transcriptional antiterminator NusG